ncbi:DegT/DnrJ/EryC1/StrS family aminotransferase [Marinifilum caeruleilacunae]|uniref:DegT/DnrJ/EryC1/StrS family aminotransferase n=1 Tax=Marinifilum caeruleilacunae TaxID=2499076 RepID=A0ABX1WQR2_9BACT|nr:DegT/DnrJ/EryC1/StrS family aminotransferase [Marinifilum caeruleilacunae]NOU58425.1 DegT/DnrJ/EryC1/StrS family aminotransferase [Marinifilum caeruleilacunae]
MDKIQMVDLYTQYVKIKDEVDQAVFSVLESSAFINGPEVKLFSEELSKYLGGSYVIPCANGTDAIQIALMALELQRGDEILVPNFTYAATAEVIALLGLSPVFVDVEPGSFNINIEDLKRKITNNTKAIIPVHLYGQCAEMESVLQIANEHQLFVVEDTAQSLGAKYRFLNGTSSYAGTLGDFGITSFFPSKNLGCYGDGGALITNKEELAIKARMIANHGQKKKYYHDIIGCNSRLDSIQAAILRVKLKYLDQYTKARQKAAEIYDYALKDIPALRIPSRVTFSDHVFNQYTIQIQNGSENSLNRDQIKSKLAEYGIPSMIYYPLPLHLQKAFRKPDQEENAFPVSQALTHSVLSLPIHPEITLSQQEFIIDKLCLTVK